MNSNPPIAGELEPGQFVEVFSFGRWYPGTIVKVNKTRALVLYTTGTRVTRTKAFPFAKIRLEPEPTKEKPCSNCGGDGTVSISIPCPDCTGIKCKCGGCGNARELKQ